VVSSYSMIIKNIRIENFRSFNDETISLNRYSCFVGSNGAGKSTVLAALNVFFLEKPSTTTGWASLGNPISSVVQIIMNKAIFGDKHSSFSALKAARDAIKFSQSVGRLFAISDLIDRVSEFNSASKHTEFFNLKLKKSVKINCPSIVI
jgi:AAA15 family ATPase/GTPase